VRLFTTWAFYYEGKRFFEGNRALFDNENIKRPIYNAFQMFEMLGDTRVQLQSAADASNVTPQIDGIATRDARGNLAICLWNFDEAGRRTGTQSIELEIRPGKDRANIERYQIDAEFSNAYAAWKRIGAPQDPTPEQIAQIKQKEDLQKVESQTAAPTSDGGLHYKFELPQPAVCLIKIT
jgi:xylan 1,4-beta-xylosidase